MALKIHYTYKTTCRVTGRFYVGMHSTDNADDGYIGSGDQLQASIKKHGKDAHTKQILGTYPTRDQLKLAEKALITEDLLKDRMCMNMAPGGGGGRLPGFKHDAAARQKISEAAKARDQSINVKISQTLLGRKNPEHSERQLARYTDKALHPKTKTLILISPEGKQTTLIGYDEFYRLCKKLMISATRLLKFFGSTVPSGSVKGGKAVTFNTIGWSLK